MKKDKEVIESLLLNDENNLKESILELQKMKNAVAETLKDTFFQL